MANFCGDCGAPLIPPAKFCGSCGRGLLQASSAMPFVPVQPGAHWILASSWSPQTINPLDEPLPEYRKLAVPKGAGLPAKRMNSNWVYVAWFLFYFILFSVATAGIAIPFFLVTVVLAFTPLAEKLWRWVSGVRSLRLKSEKERLLPLFKEVYMGAVQADPNLSRGIRLYIREDMSINAFAFGKSTLVLTRGSLMLLNDDCLKGFIAHEFGHFSHKDTEALLLATVGNFFLSFIMNKLTDLKTRFEREDRKSGIFTGFFKFLFDIVYYLFKAIDFIGELILMHTSRQNEYLADSFARKSGFGEDLTKVLTEIYEVSVSKPQSVKEQLSSSHPHVTLRIERLENALD